MAMPSISNMSTHPSDLLDSYHELSRVLFQAMGKLEVCRPMGRDYPIQSDFIEATLEYHDRIKRLSQIALEITRIVEHIEHWKNIDEKSPWITRG